ncbi:hypothetical protein [Mycobacterium marinum]|uniref:hypothetical protein n=1 Tax=Mycobacterium marinum TaxID=1781 RepID=UPI0021C45EEF|nr:hypothetical protein [Mycobacterium marinum]MDC8971080.1 hypothetical protein [Mycobacterium marinum]GJO43195.1 hypothetical protein NJB1604_18330 [Mycobacterium marinum]
MLSTQSERASSWFSETTWGSARWQRCLAALVAVVFFWPQVPVEAPTGVDPSWQAAVALGQIRHLAWGPQIVFTYGPLAFLQDSSYYSPLQAVLSTIYQVIVVAALFLGIAAALRQRHPPMTSLALAFVTTGVTAIAMGTMYPEMVVLAALAWASVPLLRSDPQRSTVFITATALGVVAGFELLVKFNTGPVVLAIALGMSLLLDWKALGRHCATVAAFAATVPVCWLLMGQPLGNLPTWLRLSSEIVSGYIDAQSVPIPLDAGGAVTLTLVWFVALFVMFFRGSPQIPRKYVVLVGVTTVLVAKSAFGRYDTIHFAALLGLMVVAMAVGGVFEILPRAAKFVVVAVVVIFVAGVVAIELRPLGVIQAPVRALDRLATVAVPGHARSHIEEAKARQRRLYDIPSRFVKTIGPDPVHIDPDETSAVWAYDFAWHPAPIFQTYSVYTPALDKLNRDTLAAGPQFVLSLRSATSPATGINGRLGVQENPLYSRALLCDFRRSAVEDHWALFTHTQPRCGPLTPISEVVVHDGKPVPVPKPSGPDVAVLVGVDLEPTFIDRLFMGSLVPLTSFTVNLDGVSYRLIAGNAAEPFLIKTPDSVSATNLEIDSRTIGVDRSRSLGQGKPTARLRFYEMHVSP